MRLVRKLRWAIIEFLAHRVAPCRHICHLLSESHDRKLGARERLTVTSHLLICDWCTQYGRQITSIDHSLKIAGERPEKLLGPGTGLPDLARKRIRDRLQSEM